LKTLPEELSDLISLNKADLETTINAARRAVSLLYIFFYDPKGKFKSLHMLILLVNIGCLLVGQTILTKIISLTWAQLSAA
jgi:hypothetical protein